MKTFLKIVLSLILILVFAEVGLHIVEALTPTYYIGNESGKGYKAQVIERFLQEQINKLWMRNPAERKTILEPPFQVFINKNFDNKERMDFIYKHSSLPANMNVTAENFLRLNKSENNYKYTATTNSLSFRGPERSIQKDKNTFRIIVLGSYPAFGHAVNDNETYPYVIEENFLKSGKKVEVWNGGRQGGTSIMGYARLINEIEKYSPDLVLWDYGWIELYLSRDRVPHKNYATLRQSDFLTRTIFDICLKTLLSSSKLCTISIRKLTKVSYSDAIAGWKESMSLVREWAGSKNIPIIYVRHKGVTIPSKEFESFHSPEKKFSYVDTSSSLNNPPTNEEVATFWSKENWLSELGYKKEDVMASEPHMIFFGDAIQYNQLGYKRIGDLLTGVIKKQFPEIL